MNQCFCLGFPGFGRTSNSRELLPEEACGDGKRDEEETKDEVPILGALGRGEDGAHGSRVGPRGGTLFPDF